MKSSEEEGPSDASAQLGGIARLGFGRCSNNLPYGVNIPLMYLDAR